MEHGAELARGAEPISDPVAEAHGGPGKIGERFAPRHFNDRVQRETSGPWEIAEQMRRATNPRL